MRQHKDKKISDNCCFLIYFLSLTLFSVSDDSQTIEKDGKKNDSYKVIREVNKVAPVQVNHSHQFHEITNRIKDCDRLRPFGHTGNRRE